MGVMIGLNMINSELPFSFSRTKMLVDLFAVEIYLCVRGNIIEDIFNKAVDMKSIREGLLVFTKSQLAQNLTIRKENDIAVVLLPHATTKPIFRSRYHYDLIVTRRKVYLLRYTKNGTNVDLKEHAREELAELLNKYKPIERIIYTDCYEQKHN